MFNIFSPTLEMEIKKNISSLNRQITSAELNLITLESHLQELYDKQSYLNERLLQLATPEPSHAIETRVILAKRTSASRESPPPDSNSPQ